MITLEENIHLSVLEFPSLFLDPYMDPEVWPLSRKAVLNQMFLVLGNGYHWEDGVLKGYGDNTPKIKRVLNAIRRNNQKTLLRIRKEVAKSYNERRASLYPLNEDGLVDFNDYQKKHLERVNANMKWKKENEMPYEFDETYYYPINSPTGYRIGILAEIPDDVKPDYLAGILEVLSYVAEYSGETATLLEQKKFAVEWIEEIKERFHVQA